LAIRFRASDLALLTPVSTAQVILSSPAGAARAHCRARMASDCPHRQRAIGLGLGLDDPQAIDTQQCGSDIPGQVPAAFWVMVSLSKIHDLKKPRAS